VTPSYDTIAATEALARLGLEKGAAPSDIRKAYRRLSLEHHPDRVQGREEKLDAQRRFIDIKEAYELLRLHPHLLREAAAAASPARAAVAEDSAAERAEELHARRRERRAAQPSLLAALLSPSEVGLLRELLVVLLCFVLLALLVSRS
jgi:curved DNA-binding protein CbpA